MAQELTIETSGGDKLYKVDEYKGKWFCYRYAGGFFSSNWDSIGEARSLEDALAICKSHATQYGRVYKVKFS
jgi:hypothetical protein